MRFRTFGLPALFIAIALFFSTTASDAAETKIRVGVIVSKTNANIAMEQAETVGYERQWRIINEIYDPAIECVPIIDADSAEDPDLAAVCRARFPGQTPVDGSDAQAVQKLDVIVASHILKLPPETFDSVELAVKSGRGFMVRMFFETGGRNATREAALIGLKPGIRYRETGSIECEVVGNHPLLANLAGTDQHIRFQANGFFGDYIGMPLVQVVNSTDLPNPGGTMPAALIYVHPFGKGMVIMCPYSGSKPTPDAFDHAGPGHFFSRAVKWLAGSDRTVTHLTQPAATTRPAEEPGL